MRNAFVPIICNNSFLRGFWNPSKIYYLETALRTVEKDRLFGGEFEVIYSTYKCLSFDIVKHGLEWGSRHCLGGLRQNR